MSLRIFGIEPGPFLSRLQGLIQPSQKFERASQLRIRASKISFQLNRTPKRSFSRFERPLVPKDFAEVDVPSGSLGLSLIA